MRVVFCWTVISGYMAACWRAFQAMPGIESRVLAWRAGSTILQGKFSEQVMQGVNCRLFDPAEWKDYDLLISNILDHKPDVVVLPGWLEANCRKLPFDLRLANVRFVMTMDTPFTDSFRQKFGRLRIRRYLDRMSRVAVPGEKAAYLARRLKFPEEKVFVGLYGIDYDSFATAMPMRLAAGDWPKRFIYTGRYCDVKAIDVLVSGYQKYRAAVNDPWPLVCCGTGPDAKLLENQTGVENHGFIQPDDLPTELSKAGAYVIASRYEPWGVSIVEAAAAGLPIIYSSVCGAAVECVRTYHTGLRFGSEDTATLARRMKWMHDHHEDLPMMGWQAQQLAAPYAAQVWARRWAAMMDDMRH